MIIPNNSYNFQIDIVEVDEDKNHLSLNIIYSDVVIPTIGETFDYNGLMYKVIGMHHSSFDVAIPSVTMYVTRNFTSEY